MYISVDMIGHVHINMRSMCMYISVDMIGHVHISMRGMRMYISGHVHISKYETSCTYQ